MDKTRQLQKRPDVSQQVIDQFSRIVDAQDEKGWVKYGRTIDAADGYDWNMMIAEEAVDALKYAVKENHRLRETVVGLGRMFDTEQAQAKRLREALEQIESLYLGDIGNDAITTLRKAYQIANQALNRKDTV